MDSEQLLAALRDDIEWPAATLRWQHNYLNPLEEALKGEPALLEIPVRRRGEPRFLVIRRLHDKHWSAVISCGVPAFASSLFAAPDLRRFASMTTSDFHRRFDDGESVLEALDLSQVRRQRLELKRVNVDFPLWMVEELDRGASHRRVTRQSIIKMWLAERLDRQAHPTDSTLLQAGEV